MVYKLTHRELDDGNKLLETQLQRFKVFLKNSKVVPKNNVRIFNWKIAVQKNKELDIQTPFFLKWWQYSGCLQVLFFTAFFLGLFNQQQKRKRVIFCTIIIIVGIKWKAEVSTKLFLLNSINGIVNSAKLYCGGLSTIVFNAQASVKSQKVALLVVVVLRGHI